MHCHGPQEERGRAHRQLQRGAWVERLHYGQLWLLLAPTWTRPVTQQSRRCSLTSSCTLQRAWRWIGSTSTSTGQTRATRPSQWPQLTVAGDALFSARTSVNPGQSLLTPCEGECPHLELPLYALSPHVSVIRALLRALEGPGSLRHSPREESSRRPLSLLTPDQRFFQHWSSEFLGLCRSLIISEHLKVKQGSRYCLEAPGAGSLSSGCCMLQVCI